MSKISGNKVRIGNDPVADNNFTLASSNDGTLKLHRGNEDLAGDLLATFDAGGRFDAKLRDFISVKDFGAVGDGVTDDTAAIQAALNASLFVVAPPSNGLAPYLISAPLTIQAQGVFDISGARITSSSPEIIRFSNNQGTLIAPNAVLTTTSVVAGYAVGLANRTNPAGIKILGFPLITNVNNDVPGSVGLDMTGFYRSYVEIQSSNFKKHIFADGNIGTTYYNVLMKPNCFGGVGATAIEFIDVNATDIYSPFISGGFVGSKGVHFIGGSAKSVHGGYIEGMVNNDINTRGIHIHDASGTTLTNVTFDSGSTVADFAIEVSGTSDATTIISPTFTGNWKDSSKLIKHTATGRINLLGNSHTDTFVLGRTALPSLANPTTFTNSLDVSGTGNVAGSAAGGLPVLNVKNSSTTGVGAVIETAATDAIRESIHAIRATTGSILRITAGGSNYQRLIFGLGSPEGVYSAEPGSLYLRRDGAAGTCFYVKESGSGNTGWVGK